MDRWISFCSIYDNNISCCFIPASQAALCTVEEISNASGEVDIVAKNRDGRWIKELLMGTDRYPIRAMHACWG